MAKKFTKKIIILSIIIGIISLGTACSNDTTTENKDNQSTSEVKELTFWSWASDSDTIKKVYEDTIKEFNSSNKFKVKIKSMYTPGEQYKTKLQTEMAANNPPSIFNMWPAGKMKPYVEADRLYPISDLMDKDSDWKGRYVDGVFDLTTFNGKTYGIPQFRVAAMVYYNKKMFKEYNLEIPKTWKELIEVIKVLNKNEKAGFALDAKEPWVSAMYAEYIADRIDPKAYQNMQKEPNWVNPTFIEVGKKIKELKDIGGFPKGATSLDYVAARNLFDQEKAGMYIMGNWDVGYFSTESPVKDSVGVLKFPEIEGGKGSVDNWLAGVEAVIAISKKCENPEAAGAYLKYLATDEVAKNKIVEEAGYVSTVKVELDSTKVSKLYIEANDLLKGAKENFAFYDVNLGSVVGDEFNNAIVSIIVGKTPEEAFKKVDEVAKEEVAKDK